MGAPSGALVVTAAALSYLTVAVLDRPAAVWVMVVVLLTMGTAADTLGPGYWYILGPIAVVGLVGGQLRRPGLLGLQAPQMLAVGTVVLTAEHGGLEIAGHLVAADPTRDAVRTTLSSRFARATPREEARARICPR